MLQNTFCHIQGIGLKTEQRLWEAGIRSWEDITPATRVPFSGKTLHLLPACIEQSRKALDGLAPRYFEKRLHTGLAWRLFPEFRDCTAYVDIETDGMDSFNGGITTIALYDGRDVYYYIDGDNIDRFPEDIQRYRVLVTYNGKCFDAPFIERFFGIELPHAHLDLRYILAALGYKGGLKACETALGIDRGLMKGLDGWYAPLLWREYRQYGHGEALETLLAYNIEDAVNLENLMVQAYNMNIAGTPFAESHRLPDPPLPCLPFRPHLATVERMKQTYGIPRSLGNQGWY